MVERRIQPLIIPETVFLEGDWEIMNNPALAQQVVEALDEREVEFSAPMIAEVHLAKGSGRAGLAMVFPLHNGCTIEVTRYGCNQSAIYIVGKRGRDILATSLPILNTQINKPENGIIKSTVEFILDELLAPPK